MQHVQKFEPAIGQDPSLVPLRVTTLRPSLWKQTKRWAQRTFTTEALIEIGFASATVFLLAVLLVGLARGLERYTIIPWP
jgi:hypothetical protein